MIISELISQLEALKAQHGDLKVVTYDTEEKQFEYVSQANFLIADVNKDFVSYDKITYCICIC